MLSQGCHAIIIIMLFRLDLLIDVALRVYSDMLSFYINGNIVLCTN